MIEVNKQSIRNIKERGVAHKKSDYLQDFASDIHAGSKNLSIAHLNIRSLRNKVDEVRLLLRVCKFDILAITETHLDKGISNRQLQVDNYKIVRRDRHSDSIGGGCLVYIANHICSMRMNSFESADIEGIWLKILVNSTAFVVGTIYRPPSDLTFFKSFQLMLEKVWLKHRNVVILGDFNCDFAARKFDGTLSSDYGKKLQSLLQQFDYTVVNNQPTRVTSNTSTLIDLVITSKVEMIKSTRILDLGISDHMLVHASVKTKVQRPPPKIVKARTFKNFDRVEFSKDIRDAPWSVCSVFDDPDDCYWAWSHIFNNICQRHAPYRETKIRRQSLPWITPQIRHLMNLRYKSLQKAKSTNDERLWSEYRQLRNRITREVRLAKTKYYTEQFDKVKDCKSYWKLVKNSTCSQLSQPILAIRNVDGSIETSDQGKAEILNEHFSTIGEKLANDFSKIEQSDVHSQTDQITTPSVTEINLSFKVIEQSLTNLKENKASGPDMVAPKLLKYAGKALIPSLFSLYSISANCNRVPDTWKLANVSALFKKGDETDKHNYRPISLLCVPGKLMETSVASTISSHILNHNLSSSHQWAYKKGHSTELLLAKMTEDWRKALDNNLVVGIVFVDFRKAFDSISHPILLQKLLKLGIAGDLWGWIKDYLSHRYQVTQVNGCRSEAKPVSFGVPQGSVLGPTLFALFCNDLPNITSSENSEIHMYADDTTIYVIGPNPDVVAKYLNTILRKLYVWCCQNLLTPHPGKSEFMLLNRSRFVGPLQPIELGGCTIKQVSSTRCLGVEIDDRLKWNIHVTALMKSFTQKLNLLRSLYFLPTQAREEFYFKVILPSVTYGLVVWGSCGKTFLANLEHIHVRAAKIIHRMDWYTPSEEVLAKVHWRTIESTYEERLLALTYNCYHGNSPVPLQELFTKNNSKYDMRKKMTIKVIKPNTDLLKKSISYQGAVLWNSLDNDTRSIDNLRAFKCAVKKRQRQS